jgi:hypothetical protein
MSGILLLGFLVYLCVKNYDNANLEKKKGGVAVLYTIGLWILGGAIALSISLLLEYAVAGSFGNAFKTFFYRGITTEEMIQSIEDGTLMDKVTIVVGGSSFAEDLVKSLAFHRVFLFVGHGLGGYLSYRLATGKKRLRTVEKKS